MASGVGGIPTFTDDGEDILHTDPDDPSTLLSAVDALLTNDELASVLAENGMKKAIRQFDWSQISQRLASIYHEIRAC